MDEIENHIKTRRISPSGRSSTDGTKIAEQVRTRRRPLGVCLESASLARHLISLRPPPKISAQGQDVSAAVAPLVTRSGLERPERRTLLSKSRRSNRTLREDFYTFLSVSPPSPSTSHPLLTRRHHLSNRPTATSISLGLENEAFLPTPRPPGQSGTATS